MKDRMRMWDEWDELVYATHKLLPSPNIRHNRPGGFSARSPPHERKIWHLGRRRRRRLIDYERMHLCCAFDLALHVCSGNTFLGVDTNAIADAGRSNPKRSSSFSDMLVSCYRCGRLHISAQETH